MAADAQRFYRFFSCLATCAVSKRRFFPLKFPACIIGIVELTVAAIAILLLIAALVGMIARRLRIPYTVGLVLTGIMLALFSFIPQISLTRDLLFTVLLPPLIFEATLFIRWKELRHNLPVILVFAVIGVILSAILTMTGMYFLAGWEWQSAALFGILIAATDPVSVIATFKEAGVQGRLRLLVEAESLFNDATAAIGFSVVLALAGGQIVTVGNVIGSTAWTIFGGLFIGAAIAGIILLFTHNTSDHLIELTLSTVAAYGSFLIAEQFHASGVLSTLTAGILIGNFGLPISYSDKGRASLVDFWEFAAFISNSLIFLLIGIRQAAEIYAGALWPVIVAIFLVTFGRAAAIYSLSALFNKSKLKIELNHRHILFWGGLRGALALALALGLPPEIPRRAQIVTAAFGVVAFSIFAQGLTITPLLRRLKEINK
ncbi:MAG: sodium:proton antiporter [Chloroflexi bacterium]|nr:sodium:proton antiporter [Chloroflexota bacterium]MBI3339959.1 sodium:proton antiporter [Chloroflexota bacterium]